VEVCGIKDAHAVGAGVAEPSARRQDLPIAISMALGARQHLVRNERGAAHPAPTQVQHTRRDGVLHKAAALQRQWKWEWGWEWGWIGGRKRWPGVFGGQEQGRWVRLGWVSSFVIFLFGQRFDRAYLVETVIMELVRCVVSPAVRPPLCRRARNDVIAGWIVGMDGVGAKERTEEKQRARTKGEQTGRQSDRKRERCRGREGESQTERERGAGGTGRTGGGGVGDLGKGLDGEGEEGLQDDRLQAQARTVAAAGSAGVGVGVCVWGEVEEVGEVALLWREVAVLPPKGRGRAQGILHGGQRCRGQGVVKHPHKGTSILTQGGLGRQRLGQGVALLSVWFGGGWWVGCV
jgi:hypothetical protein